MSPKSSTSTITPSSSSSSPLPSESVDGRRLIESEFVQAQHDWEPDNPTYLSFRKGQIIRVFNRDPSGWWDGELEGQRGWFPSNYVQPAVPNIDSLPDDHRSTYRLSLNSAGSVDSSSSSSSSFSSSHRHSSSGRSESFSSASSSSRSYDQSILASSFSEQSLSSIGKRPETPNLIGNHRRPSILQNKPSSIEDPVAHAVALLHNAAAAGRVFHFQPSTACIISSIRSIFSSTDCLSKESAHIKAHPDLARARKHILAQLSKLVTQTRIASDQTVSVQDQPAQVEVMLSMARKLLADVKRFLQTAVECGVEMPDRQVAESSASETEGTIGGVDINRTPKPSSPAAAGSVRKFSPGPNQRYQAGFEHRAQRSLMTRTQSTTELLSKERAPGSMLSYPDFPSTPQDRSRPFGEMNRNRLSASPFPSDSPTFRSTTPSEHGPLDSSIITHIQTLHDEVISILAAFIGHIHFHSTSSHPSSHAHILDVTQACLSKTTSLLSAIDRVCSNLEIKQTRPAARLVELKEARAGLYDAVDRLVSSAQDVASLPSSNHAVDEDAGQREGLLVLATRTARSAGVCKNALEKYVGPSEGDGAVDLGPAPILAEQETTVRARRTLSTLNKKATAIDTLRRRGAEDEDEEGEDKACRDREQTITPVRRESVSSTGSSIREDGEMRRWRERKSSLAMTSGPFLSSFSFGGQDMSSRTLSNSSTGSLSFSTNTTCSASTPPRLSFELHQEAPLVRTDSSSSDDLPDDPSQALTPQLKSSPHPQAAHLHSQYSPSTATKSSSPFPTFSFAVPLDGVSSPDFNSTDFAQNSEGHIIGATLPALVAKLTPHTSVADPSMSQMFFLTFRMFTTPQDLLDQVIHRFDMQPPAQFAQRPAELALWRENRVVPIQLRVYQFLIAWLDSFWRHDTDHVVLPKLRSFTQTLVMEALPPQYGPRLIRSLEAWESSVAPQGIREPMATLVDKARSADSFRGAREKGPTATLPPTPVINKSLLNNLRSQPSSIAITEFDPLELARQFTLLEYSRFRHIKPEDLLEIGKRASAALTAMSTFSNQVTGFVSETILNEKDSKKRTGVMKFFVKFATRLVDLQNFSGGYAVVAALNSASITRLKKTFGSLSTKTKSSLSALRDLYDVSRNHMNYRSCLRKTSPPALPFLGIALTDITFCNDGNADTRASPQAPDKVLINLAKYQGLWRIVNDVQKFQVPFSLAEVPEVQAFLSKALAEKGSGSLDGLYQKSLELEPRTGRASSTPSLQQP